MKCPNCNSEIPDNFNKQYELNIEERKMLIDAAREGSRTFDKAILTLTSGAFGLSFVFLKDIVPSPLKETLFLLSWSWLFFSISLVIILASFLTSQQACYSQIKLIFKEKEKDEKNWWTIVTSICNIISIISLIFAFYCMGKFIFLNVISKQ